MLDDLARAQLEVFLLNLQSDPKVTIPLGTLKHFIGADGVAEIKSLRDDLDKSKKQSGNLSLSDGAKAYWRKFKLLRKQADHSKGAGTRASEKKLSRLSETLRDEFFRIVPESEWRKFRIHDGPEDEANWDWRWEGLEHRPPLLLESLEQSFPIERPMNYAQQEVVARYASPPIDDYQSTDGGFMSNQTLKLRKLADPDFVEPIKPQKGEDS